MAELCREFGISRKTGYKWAQRFLDGGMPNLVDRLRAPHVVRHAVSSEVVDAIVALRRQFSSWGPKKLDAYLRREYSAVAWPSRTTMGTILRRHGLIEPPRRRRTTPPMTQPLAAATEPNVVWCTDFKGKFRVDGRYCHPLTITDACARFVLRCKPLQGEQIESSRVVFESTFREFGLPLRMRSDNGIPFASTSIGGLSRLSVWWIKLGIFPERIEPGHPEQNGRHERMHRTLKADVASPPRRSWEAQELALERWRQEFNQVRPHEALSMRTPASVYAPSPRPYPEVLADPEYPSHFDVRRIRKDGFMKMHEKSISLGAVLQRECVGVEAIADGIWHLWFGPVFLGRITELGRGKLQLNKNRPLAKRPGATV